MDVIQQVVVMLATLAVLIAFHEYGHFWVARRCGVKVIRFSIGFGTPIFRWKDKLDTEYVISVLPLGGYVKMLDERESEDPIPEEEKPYAFNNKSVRQRMAIVSAGPIANFLLSILVYWFVFLNGVTGLAPIMFGIEKDSLADRSGIVEGQEIVAVDGVETSTVQKVSLQLIKRVGDTGDILVDTRIPGSDLVEQHRIPVTEWLGHNTDDMDLFGDLGIEFYRPQVEPVIDRVMEDSAASEAGLQSGDRLVKADGKVLDDWYQWVDYVQARPDVRIDLVVERAGLPVQLSVTPRLVEYKSKKVGQVGVSPIVPEIPQHLIKKQSYNIFTAWLPALERTGQMTLFTLRSIKKMLFGEISYKQLSGPISIAKVASQSADTGIYSYLSLLALLSVSLGVLNLLPIPVLDGGHIMFYLIEWIKGDPVPEKVQIFAYQIGIAVVLSIMVLAIVNDISRL